MIIPVAPHAQHSLAFSGLPPANPNLATRPPRAEAAMVLVHRNPNQVKPQRTTHQRICVDAGALVGDYSPPSSSSVGLMPVTDAKR